MEYKLRKKMICTDKIDESKENIIKYFLYLRVPKSRFYSFPTTNNLIEFKVIFANDKNSF